MKNISKSSYLKIKIPLPPLPEQKKIADILSTWDKAIETTQALIDKLQLRKKGLMQQLLTGKKRLPGFEGEWEEVKLNECAKNENQRNKGKHGSEKLFGVNKKLGLIPMKEQVKGKNFDRCKIVKQSWFAYNPMRINIGSIVQHSHEKELMVSRDYVVFSCNEDKLLSVYLNLFRRGHIWNQFMINAGNGSVRIRIYFKDLGFLKIPLPTVAEQTAITQVLTKADEEIDQTQSYLKQLQEQKKGLMQQLLTGQKRVQV